MRPDISNARVIDRNPALKENEFQLALHEGVVVSSGTETSERGRILQMRSSLATDLDLLEGCEDHSTVRRSGPMRPALAPEPEPPESYDSTVRRTDPMRPALAPEPAPPESYDSTVRRADRTIMLFLGAAVLGVVLALAWRQISSAPYRPTILQAGSVAPKLQTEQPSQQTSSPMAVTSVPNQTEQPNQQTSLPTPVAPAAASVSDSQLDQIAGDLDQLRAGMAELTSHQKKSGAGFDSIQRELQTIKDQLSAARVEIRKIAIPGASWLSEPAALTFRAPPSARPSAEAVPKRPKARKAAAPPGNIFGW